MSDLKLFSRLATVHKPDCAVFQGDVTPVQTVNPAQLAETLGSEEIARYAQDCQPVFENLRRVIGQIAGLLILAQLTQRSDVAELKELEVCKERLLLAEEQVEALRAPAEVSAHYQQLKSAQVFSGHAVGTFPFLRSNRENMDVFDQIARHMHRAYAHLRAATSENAGLEMVDLTHACCSCGR